MTTQLAPVGPPTTQSAPPAVPETLEHYFALQANDAIMKGADPQAVTARLGQYVQHLRANPDIAAQANDAIGKGADPAAVAARYAGLSSGAARPTVAKPGSGALGAAESFTQGLLGGFADEIGGAGAAAIDAVGNVARGKPANFSANYRDYRDAARTLDSDFAQAHPFAHAAIETVGGAVPALVTDGATEAAIGSKLAPSFARKVVSSSITGAGTTALFAAGNNTGSATDRLIAGAKAAPVGAVVGAAVPVAVSAAGKAPALVRTLVRSSTGLGTKAEAIRQLGEVVGQSGKTADQIASDAAAHAAAGSPVILADELGDTGRKIVRWTVNQPGEGAADLTDDLTNRHVGQYGRILNGIRQTFGTDIANLPETRDALLQAKRANAAPLYAKAYADPAYSSANLDAAMQYPPFRRALEQGQNLAHADELAAAIRAGSPPPAKPLPIGTTDPAVAAANAQLATAVKANPGMNQDAIGRLAKLLGADPGSLDGATAETGTKVPIKVLDYAKRYLDKGIRRGFDANSGFDHTTAHATNDVLNGVLDEVDQQRPNWLAARAKYHSDARMEEMADLGEKAHTMTPDELQQALKGATPDEMDVARKTFLGAYKDRAGAVRDQNDLAARFLADPNMRARFAIMAPDQSAADATQALADRESLMARTYKAATGNSTTAQQQMVDRAINGGISPADIAVLPISPHRTIARLAGHMGEQLRNQANIKLSNELSALLRQQPGTPAFDDVIAALRDGNGAASATLPSNRALFRNALLQAFAAQSGSGQRNP